jgi:hypothetical protein
MKPSTIGHDRLPPGQFVEGVDAVAMIRVAAQLVQQVVEEDADPGVAGFREGGDPDRALVGHGGRRLRARVEHGHGLHRGWHGDGSFAEVQPDWRAALDAPLLACDADVAVQADDTEIITTFVNESVACCNVCGTHALPACFDNVAATAANLVWIGTPRPPPCYPAHPTAISILLSSRKNNELSSFRC